MGLAAAPSESLRRTLFHVSQPLARLANDCLQRDWLSSKSNELLLGTVLA